MANTLNLSALPEYIEQNRDQLFVEATLGAKTLDYVELMLGVKHKEALNYLSSEIVLAAAQCGWNPQGSDTIAQRYIEVHLIEVEKEYCAMDMKQYFMNWQLNWDAHRDTLPFEEKISQSNVARVQEAVEDAIWNGLSGASVTGFLADAAEASATTVEFGSGATTVGKIDAIVAALTPKMLKKGVNIFMGYTDYRNYVMESNGSNCCANRPILDAASESITYAGDSRVKLVFVGGLENSGKIVAATPDALVVGTDVEGAETDIRWFYDEKEQKHCFRILFALGTQIKFVDEVIVGE